MAVGSPRLLAIGAIAAALLAALPTLSEGAARGSTVAVGVLAGTLLLGALGVARRAHQWSWSAAFGVVAGIGTASASIAAYANDGDAGIFDEPWSTVGWAASVVLLLGAPRIAREVGRPSVARAKTPWERLSSDEDRRLARWRERSAARGAGAAAVVIVAAFAPYPYATESDFPFPGPSRSVLALSAAAVIVMVVGFVLVGRRLVQRRHVLDQAEVAFEREAVAAHLHDSVLQTLALIQRTADPEKAQALARRQERDLRRWLAGRDDHAGERLADALRAICAEVEDEQEVSIGCVTVGDLPLDERTAALVWAAREALRNAARHGDGKVQLFGEVEDVAVLVYVRDEGPGFDLAAVSHQRRGVRDAILGRMRLAGGYAEIDSGPTGTEVRLVLPLRADDDPEQP